MALVLVPGFMTDATLWDDCLPAFSTLGPIHHVDMFQDGLIEDIAERALRDAPGRFFLIGFSFGGYVAREMVRRAPDRVRALVLVATSARGTGPVQARAAQAAATAIPETFGGLSRRAIERSLHPNHADAETIERIQSMSVRLGADVFRRQTSVPRPGDVDRLGEIRCPTLVIAAASDRLRSLEEARELAKGIPHANLVVIEGAGHMIPIEVPEEFAKVVLDWTSDANTRGGREIS